MGWIVKPRLLVLFLVLVTAPLLLLGWTSWRLATDEERAVLERMTALLQGRLKETENLVLRFLETRERELLAALASTPPRLGALRDLARRNPLVRIAFLLDNRGRLIHPHPEEGLATLEREFVERMASLRLGQELGRVPAAEVAGSSFASARPNGPPGHGWYTVYFGRGVSLIFWSRRPSGQVVGVELDTIRLLADLVGELPTTDPTAEARAAGRMALMDFKGASVYQWGSYRPVDGQVPAVTLPLKPPLDYYRLALFVPQELFTAPGAGVRAVTGPLGAALGFILLALYLYREYSRDLREASARVSFVNQVSHELRTPLTNIRLYAELLERELPDEEPTLQQYVANVVTESQRLTRLVGNVLAFARKAREAPVLHPASAVLDDVVAAMLKQFEPAFGRHGIQVSVDAGASRAIQMDADAVGQIIGNLLGNIEKYAAKGKVARIRTRLLEDTAEVLVSDAGPGIPVSLSERIFQPFYRLSSRLTDGVAGTGIGLTIARDLARLHGGDLVLQPSETGATFRLTIHGPPAARGNS
jgi:signal transduction histidine kinase